MIWKIKQQLPEDIIAALLSNRGFATITSSQEFLKPTQPELIPLAALGINSEAVSRAIVRINTAITNQEAIYIYGDYDADGVSSTAILWETLNALGAKVLPYIPTRSDPVRGLSPQGIKAIIKLHPTPFALKPSLIITVDNGISAFKGCQAAKKLGIDVIITDHHVPPVALAKGGLPVLAIIHTTQLAGAGVAWFFAREIIKKLGSNIYDLTSSLDLAALGTIADMVPLIGANRSLAKYGLVVLRQSPRFGLQALAKISGLDLSQISESQISFALAPRLNAMGRLEHALDSLRLICTKDEAKSLQLAEHLQQVNELRQDKTLIMFQDAKKKYLSQKNTPALIFVSGKDYHEGVVGLVAGRLAEEFHRPAAVVALAESTFKASIRSIKGFNAIKAIRSLGKYLLEHGGHELAAGFTAENKNLTIIQKKLEQLAKQALSKKDLEPVLNIDCQLDFSQLNWELFNSLEDFKPYGFNNPQPVFCSRGVKLLNFRGVGQDNKHLKLKLEKFDCIGFNQGYLINKLKVGQLIDVAYKLESNEWNNKTSLQLKIIDITINL